MSESPTATTTRHTRSAFQPREVRQTLRPIILEVLAACGSAHLDYLESTIRRRAGRVLSEDVVQQNIVSLATVGLVSVDADLNVSLTADGALVCGITP